MSDESNYFGDDAAPLDQVEDETVDASSRVRHWPLMDESPVIPLGFVGGKVVFVMPEGNVRQELASKIPQLLKVDIYVCGKGGRFLQNFMAEGEKGRTFLRDAAAMWFNRHCRQMGPWDLSREERMVGVWPEGPGGEDIALHLGDEIWVPDPAGEGGWRKLSVFDTFREVRTGPVWVLTPPTPRPEKPVTVADGAWVMETLRAWRFEPIGPQPSPDSDGEPFTGADILAGWIMVGLLGGVPRFRGHLLLFAMKGSGKTTLMRLVHALMRVMVEKPITDFSEPGLRGELASRARSVIIDEAENKQAFEGPSLIDRALEVLRPMATDEGGNRKMGSVDGSQKTQTARGSALLGATKPPRLNPADASRFAEIKLLTLREEGGFVPRPDAEIAAAIERARAMAPGLLGRAVQGAQRYLADVDAIKIGMSKLGHEPRTGDLVAMLAAGRRLLLYDHPLTPDEVEAELVRFRPLLEQRVETEHVANDGQDLLMHVLNFNSGQHYNDRFLKIGELIDRMLENPEHQEWPKVLAGHGLRLARGLEVGAKDKRRRLDGDWLLVANGHPGMKAITRGTDYGDWRRTFSYLEDLGPEHAQEKVEPLRFGPGAQLRSLAIPLAPWFSRAVQSSARPLPSEGGTDRAGGVPRTVPAFGIDSDG